jgi:hypothetical protein
VAVSDSKPDKQPPQTVELRLLSADEVVGALIRGLVGLAPGMSMLAEIAGLGLLVAGRLDRMRQTALEMRDTAGDEQTLVKAIQESEDVEVLVIEALEAASRTALREKRLLLGRIIGRAVLDDAPIDEAQLITAALGELDAPHIRALERLRRAEEDIDAHAREQADKARADEMDPEQGDRAWSNRFNSIVGDAVRRTGDGEPVSIRATLIRTGVVLPATVLDGGASIYRVSDFGRQLLAELADPSASGP